MKVISLKNKEQYEVTTSDTEICIVILSGTCSIDIDFGKYVWNELGKRNSVFEGTPDSVYIPCKSKASLLAKSKLRIAVITANAKIKYEPFVVYHDAVSCEERGNREWKRSVYDIITSENKVNSLFIGETIHSYGVWSGYPPHKHDTDNGDEESKNSEIYYVEIEPEEAFAVFVQYGKDWEKATILKNRDMIYVEDGYHAVVSAAGAKFYYLWALDSINRKFNCKTDENYFWVQ